MLIRNELRSLDPDRLARAVASGVVPARWTYSVIDPVTSEMLATNVNPTVSPYKWKRPSAGWMIAATFGYAHWNTDGDLTLGWINEMVEQEACSS